MRFELAGRGWATILYVRALLLKGFVNHSIERAGLEALPALPSNMHSIAPFDYPAC